MSRQTDLITLAQQVPETTLCPIDALIDARIQDMLRHYDLSDTDFELVRGIAEDMYRQGLHDGVVRVGELLTK